MVPVGPCRHLWALVGRGRGDATLSRALERADGWTRADIELGARQFAEDAVTARVGTDETDIRVSG